LFIGPAVNKINWIGSPTERISQIQVNCFHFSFFYVSLIADFLTQDDWNIVNHIFIAMSTSAQRMLDCKRSITAPVNYKDSLKIDGTLARLSNANLRRPQRGRRGRRGRRGSRLPSAARRLIKLQRILGTFCLT
jgi:hypothetical protein